MVSEQNGNVVAWRVGQLEEGHRETRRLLDDRHRESRQEIERLEAEVNKLKVQLATWAAGGAALANAAVELIKYAASRGGP